MTEAILDTAGTRPVLRFERFLPESIDLVWHAVTDPVEMRSWFPTRIEIDAWTPGATLTHHFDGTDMPSLPGVVIECAEPYRLVFTWGDDVISFELSAAEGGTRFQLSEELGASHVARNAAGWEVCLERLVEGRSDGSWESRFAHYTAEFEPILGHQDGPPVEAHIDRSA